MINTTTTNTQVWTYKFFVTRRNRKGELVKMPMFTEVLSGGQAAIDYISTMNNGCNPCKVVSVEYGRLTDMYLMEYTF